MKKSHKQNIGIALFTIGLTLLVLSLAVPNATLPLFILGTILAMNASSLFY